MNFFFDCTKQAFDTNPAKYAKKNLIIEKCKPENSLFFEYQFLLDFYVNTMNEEGKEPDLSTVQCYEKLLDFWAAARLQRLYNESEVVRIGKELDVLHSENNFWGDLGSAFSDLGSLLKYAPYVLGAIAVGYLINAVKK